MAKVIDLSEYKAEKGNPEKEDSEEVKNPGLGKGVTTAFLVVVNYDNTVEVSVDIDQNINRTRLPEAQDISNAVHSISDDIVAQKAASATAQFLQLQAQAQMAKMQAQAAYAGIDPSKLRI